MKNRKIRKWIKQNVKKVLALVLAFACAFTMFAGAAFTDAADVSQTEAVDMLTALGVIDGYEDGSFRPDETVTRAEMAKMIYVIRNGGSDEVSQYEGYKTPFTDVENVNHWAKGYIAYCYANGIIAGKSATKFDPDATVTGTEAAKMALVLLGYDPAKAGLEGSAWATNTINLATQKDLFKDYTISITGGCDRQYAAQLLYNTLWACTVRWSADAEDYEDVTVASDSTDGVTIGLLNVTVAKKYMGLEEVKGIYQGDNKINTGLKATESKVGGKTITFVPAEGNDLVGESVKVLYKENKNGVNGLDPKDTIYGITLSGDTTTVKATLGDIGDFDGTTPSKIKVDGTKYDVYSTGADVYVNFVSQGAKQNASTFTTNYKQDSADAVKLVLNDNGDVISAYITHVVFTKVTGLTSDKISLESAGTLDIDDMMQLDPNVAKGDIVALTTLYSTPASDDDAFNIIDKAEVAAGVKVTNMNGTGTEVMIDGAYSKVATYNDSISDSNYVNAATLDSTYDFVKYGKYWVAAKEVEAAAKNIVLVTGKGTDGLDNRVKVMFPDGSEKTYDYDDNNGTVAFGTITIGDIYSYTLLSDSKIQLKQSVAGLTYVDTDTADAGKTNFFNKDNKTFYLTTAGSMVADSEAAVFVAYDSIDVDVAVNDYYAYSADSIDTILYSSVDATITNNDSPATVIPLQYFTNNDGEIVAICVGLTVKPGSSASTEQYGYVVDDQRATSVDGTKYYEISVWNGTEVVTLKVESSSPVMADGNTIIKGSAIEYKVGADGITSTSDLHMITRGNIAAVSSYDEGRSLLNLYKDPSDTTMGVNAYKVSDDCVVIGVNTKDNKSAEGFNAVIEALVNGSNVATENVMVVLNAKDEVVAVYVDSKNEIDNTDIQAGARYVAP